MFPSSAHDLRITRTERIEPPATLLAELPLSAVAREGVVVARRAIGEVLAGRDDRLLCIVGPCSIHDVAAAPAVEFTHASRGLDMARLPKGWTLNQMGMFR